MAVVSKGVKLSDFSRMTPAEKLSAINSLVRPVIDPTLEEMKDDLGVLRIELETFERCYGMSSEDMVVRYNKKPTGDFKICKWYSRYRVFKNLALRIQSTQANLPPQVL